MTKTVLAHREGAIAILQLNRPEALNALDLGMVRRLTQAYDAFGRDRTLAAIVLEGAGPRGFCAGGDIRAVHVSGRAKDGIAETFWREEYELIARFAASRVPIVALMDGIVMGGGAGLGMHVAHRIVTERTRFAMPEVGIGFLPDVGATFRLPRAPDGFGRYLALTGDAVGAADVIAAGLADAHVPSHRLPDLKAALAALVPGASSAEIEPIVSTFSTEPEPGLFASEGQAIRAAFSDGDAASAAAVLATVGPDEPSASFAVRTRQLLATRSPFSLRLTEALLERGEASHNLEECLTREFRAACRCLAVEDFYEGVRAAVIDKDRNPRWPSASERAFAVDIDEALAPKSGIADPVFAAA